MIRGLLLFCSPYTLSSLTYNVFHESWWLEKITKTKTRKIVAAKTYWNKEVISRHYIVWSSLLRLKGLILFIHLTGILLAILGGLFQVLRLELAYNKVNFKNYGNVKSDKVCYYKALQ